MNSSRLSSFTRLAAYITNAQNKQERVGAIRITNCESLTPDDAALEIEATQRGNTRASGDRTYHLLLSFPVDEVPDARTLVDIEERICGALGFDEHQRISAVHADTDNLHVHVAINKIHPQRYTMHEPYYPYRTLGDMCTKLEAEYGLQAVNHISGRTQSEGRARDMERHSGMESLVSWMRRECLSDIRDASSWDALHQATQEHGVTARLRGNGLVFQADDGTTIKASTLARDLSKPQLEKRLGAFEAAPDSPTHGRSQYEPRPIRSGMDATELYARYKNEQAEGRHTRSHQIQTAMTHRNALVADAKRSGRQRRRVIKLMRASPYAKRLLYAQASKRLRQEITKAHAAYRAERRQASGRFQGQAWADWLKSQAEQGDRDALKALRHRRTSKRPNGDYIASPYGNDAVTPASFDSITKAGTIIYRAGAGTARDTGGRLHVPGDLSARDLASAIRLAAQHYGPHLDIRGSAAFRNRVARVAATAQLPVTFTDAALDARRSNYMQQENGHERRNRTTGRAEQQRLDRRRARRAGQRAGVAGAGHGHPGTRGHGIGGISAASIKPHVRGVGRKPPSNRRNNLRALSSLPMVRDTQRSEVLLPRDVPHNVEHQRPAATHSLRRPGDRAGLAHFSAIQLAAADKYIDERRNKRAAGVQLPPHARYSGVSGKYQFNGVRTIDGQKLALLADTQGTVQVFPVDNQTATRLRRSRIGDQVRITDTHTIRRVTGRTR